MNTSTVKRRNSESTACWYSSRPEVVNMRANQFRSVVKITLDQMHTEDGHHVGGLNRLQKAVYEASFNHRMDH